MSKRDIRKERTRDRLGDSLIDLLLERQFDDITVQEVLDHANVSRSTFYEHFRDKNDLLLSDVDDFFSGMSTLLVRTNERSLRVAPVKELFSHVADARDLYTALTRCGKIAEVRELSEAHFAKTIATRLSLTRPHKWTGEHERTALAHALAGTLFSLLSWWIRVGVPLDAARMDELFHSSVVSP